MAVSNAPTFGGPDLRRARRMADVTQERLAVALGVRRQRVQAVEQLVRVTPTFATRYLAALERLADS